jgi:hypothetical protein
MPVVSYGGSIVDAFVIAPLVIPSEFRGAGVDAGIFALAYVSVDFSDIFLPLTVGVVDVGVVAAEAELTAVFAPSDTVPTAVFDFSDAETADLISAASPPPPGDFIVVSSGASAITVGGESALAFTGSMCHGSCPIGKCNPNLPAFS